MILTINSVLLWEKEWYAGLIASLNTGLFLTFWIWDPSVISTIATILLSLNIAEFVVPKLIASIYNTDAWTGAKEKQFEEICRTIAMRQFQAMAIIGNWQELKVSKPKLVR